MIIVKQKHGQKAKGHGDKDPFDLQVPKVDKPTSVLCGIKGLRDRNSFDMR